MTKTILSDIYGASVKSWGLFLGQEVPEEFEGFKREYEKIRSGFGLVDFSFRGRVQVTGKDRINFLHRLLSIDVKNLAPGECVTGCFLTGTAKIQCLLDITVTENAVCIDTHESRAKHVIQIFEKYHFNEDVAFEDVSESFGEIAIVGSQKEVVSGKGIFLGKNWNTVWTRSSEDIPKASWIGFKAFDAYRIEVREPYFGIDIDETTLQPETGHDAWASTRKGCYAGQEIIQRVRNFGHPTKRLVTFVVDTQSSVTGAKVFAEGNEVGRITSSGLSPRFQKTVALGFVPFEMALPGKKFEIKEEGENSYAEGEIFEGS